MTIRIMSSNLLMTNLDEIRISVIGLGYVGLPLAVAFSQHWPTVGFDISNARISELKVGHDQNLEISVEELTTAENLSFFADTSELSGSNIYVITVPTPVDVNKRPDITALQKASETVGQYISEGDVVIYESTVFPGATEEECVPILENVSGLKFNQNFFVGYSPERINPGDKLRRLTDIRKVTSGSTPETARFVDKIYSQIVAAGTHMAPSIRVAEMAKVIENTQRDLNIALVNELALICNRLDINTLDVLEAAGTKWNFLNFKPGLVGGHCIGVDPYYLTHKAQSKGYHPDVVLAGRRLNDGMGVYVANSFVRALIKAGATIRGARVLIMGLTFKENCPDLRNSRVIDVIRELESFGVNVDVYDPWADPKEAKKIYSTELCEPFANSYDGVLISVAHKEFKEAGLEKIQLYGRPNVVIFDLKGIFRNSSKPEALNVIEL